MAKLDNRLITYLIIAVLAAMGLIVMINLSTFFFTNAQETYLGHYDVRGMAIQHNQKLYTLNFSQQNAVLDILNHSVSVTKPKIEKTLTSPQFDKIIIYRFNQPDVNLSPVGYSDDNLIFALPGLKPNTFLMEMSAGFLKELLSKTYD